MRFYAARMSSHANKDRLKQGIRHRREGVRRGREGDPEAPDPGIAVWVLVAVTGLERQAESTAATTDQSQPNKDKALKP